MKNIITSILISAVITTLGVYAFYNWIPIEPIKYLEHEEAEQMLGATVTTINATDKIKDSRAVINTNFTNLNTDKVEVGTTTLPLITDLPNLDTIGTITTGVWNGTTITVSNGGTGLATIPQYQLIVGSSTNAVFSIPIGTSGQVLQSNGAGAIPSFESGTVDESLNYDWTGLHSWTATTTMATSTIGAIIVGGSDSGTVKIDSFTSAGADTWTKPYGAKKVFVEIWGGGGSGGANIAGPNPRAGGGGGGGYIGVWFDASDLSATETLVIAAGGVAVTGDDTDGNVGGNSTFGASLTLVTAYGGGGGAGADNVFAGGGGGGGSLSVGATSSTGTGALGGSPGSPLFGNGGGNLDIGNDGQYSGGGGGVGVSSSEVIGGDTIFGGAGGGASAAVHAGGTSIFGGAGGASAWQSATPAGTGVQPGGGGGGAADNVGGCTSGAGAIGQIIITTYF